MAARADFLAAHPTFHSVQDTFRAWDRSRPRNDDLLDDLRFCLASLHACGLDQVIVVDQTSPEQRRIGATTARVLVPGLAPIDFGYYYRRAASIERMYGVPKALAGVNVDQLNPLPHMFP